MLKLGDRKKINARKEQFSRLRVKYKESNRLRKINVGKGPNFDLKNINGTG